MFKIDNNKFKFFDNFFLDIGFPKLNSENLNLDFFDLKIKFSKFKSRKLKFFKLVKVKRSSYKKIKTYYIIKNILLFFYKWEKFLFFYKEFVFYFSYRKNKIQCKSLKV